jgi:hypothetical protein
MQLINENTSSKPSTNQLTNPRFIELKEKYKTILDSIERNNLKLQDLRIKDNRLLIVAKAPTQDAANRVWDQIQVLSPHYEDLIADISVRRKITQSLAATAGGRLL